MCCVGEAGSGWVLKEGGGACELPVGVAVLNPACVRGKASYFNAGKAAGLSSVREWHTVY